MAVEGWVDLTTDSLDIKFALLNPRGCALNSGTMFGALDSIEKSRIKVVKSILAPVTNLLTNQKKCDIFYDGKVKQPKKE